VTYIVAPFDVHLARVKIGDFIKVEVGAFCSTSHWQPLAAYEKTNYVHHFLIVILSFLIMILS